MEKLGFGLDDDSTTCDQKETNPQESNLLSIHRCIKYLIHAIYCSDDDCRLPSCQKMKRVVQHAKSCQQKKGRVCPICKELLALCSYHAKYCQEATCPVPLCGTIKYKLRHKQLQQKLRGAQILKRRIAFMLNHDRSCPVVQTSPGNSNSSNQPTPGAQPHSSSHPPKPSIGMKPATGPPVNAFEASQVQAATARKTGPQHVVAASVNYGKDNHVISSPASNAGLMSTQQMQAQMQKSMSQMMLEEPIRRFNMSNFVCLEDSGYAQNPQLQNSQPAPQTGLRQHTHILGGPGNMPKSIGNSSMGPPQVMPNQEPSSGGMQRPIQGWQQLLQVLKSPPSAQQQQQVLFLLKSNPQLMAAFIKSRTAQLQQQQ